MRREALLEDAESDVKSQQSTSAKMKAASFTIFEKFHLHSIYQTFSQAELRMGLEAWQQMQPGNGHVADCWKQIFVEDQRLVLKGLKWLGCCDLRRLSLHNVALIF